MFSAFQDITFMVDASGEVDLSEINSLNDDCKTVGQEDHSTADGGRWNHFLYDTAAGSLDEHRIVGGDGEDPPLDPEEVWTGLELAGGVSA